ncbi:hypothetical protein ACX12M_19470 [Cellulosimicrobium cellulans]
MLPGDVEDPAVQVDVERPALRRTLHDVEPLTFLLLGEVRLGWKISTISPNMPDDALSPAPSERRARASAPEVKRTIPTTTSPVSATAKNAPPIPCSIPRG